MYSIVDKVRENKELDKIKKEWRLSNIDIAFLVSIFFSFTPNLLSKLEINKWLPQNITDILVSVFDSIFLNYVTICIVLSVTFFLIYYMPGYIEKAINHLNNRNGKKESNWSFFDFLPKGIDYTDGTTDSWNYLKFQKYPYRLFERISTTYFIFWFAIIVFLKNESLVNWLKVGENPSANDISLRLLFFVNTIMVFFTILKSRFLIKHPTSIRSLKYYEIEGKYLIINEKTVENYTKSILFTKSKYETKVNTKFIVWSLKSFNRENIWLDFSNEYQKQAIYQPINITENFNEAQYHFEILKNDINKI